MTTSLPPIAHAMQRAKERYGIDLSWADLHDIAQRCKAGEGFTDRKPDGSNYHVIILRERVLWAVYRRPSAFDPDGVVVTIMPPEIGAKLVARDAKHMAQRQGHRRMRKAWR